MLDDFENLRTEPNDWNVASDRSIKNRQPEVEPGQSRITIFAVPKPFSDSATDTIQLNAIRSWASLAPAVDVLLLGDEPGIAEVASELGVRHTAGLKMNEHGTPMLSSAFEIAHQETDTPFLVYCNCDVILLNDFVASMERLAESELKEFVAFARRTDLAVDGEVNFENLNSIQELKQRKLVEGLPCSVVCKEFFAFNRGLFKTIPDFAVGRGNWDNWMIHHAKSHQIPAVDISQTTNVIHQLHDYSHIKKGRWNVYVGGAEAKENERLAGGRNLISGSTPTHRLCDRGITKVPFEWLNLSFWRDVPRFLRLMRNLMVNR